MQSEKKLRINGLLKLHSSSGVVNIKTFLDQFSDVKKDARDLSFITMFSMCDIGPQRQEDLSADLETDYIAKKKQCLEWHVQHASINLVRFVSCNISILKLILIF